MSSFLAILGDEGDGNIFWVQSGSISLGVLSVERDSRVQTLLLSLVRFVPQYVCTMYMYILMPGYNIVLAKPSSARLRTLVYKVLRYAKHHESFQPAALAVLIQHFKLEYYDLLGSFFFMNAMYHSLSPD